MMKKVLFICSHNSARSQMAEGLVNHYHSKRWVAHSAGTKPTSVHPMAIKTMNEIGIDISHHHAKSLTDFKGDYFDLVITLCDEASETCPTLPGEKVVHKAFPDPSRFQGTEDERLEAFDRTRNDIRDWLATVL